MVALTTKFLNSGSFEDRWPRWPLWPRWPRWPFKNILVEKVRAANWLLFSEQYDDRKTRKIFFSEFHQNVRL